MTLVCKIDDVAFNDEVVINKLGGVSIVGVDAANLGGGKIDLINCLAVKKVFDSILIE